MKLSMSPSEMNAMVTNYTTLVSESAKTEVKLQELQVKYYDEQRKISDLNYELSGAKNNATYLRQDVERLSAANAQLHTELRMAKANPVLAHEDVRDLFVLACAELFRANKVSKIEAIKTLRQLTSLGLKEAKDLVEGNYSTEGSVHNLPTLGDLIKQKLAEHR